MSNGWTQERRERQSLLIRSWRPWDKATGPKSPEGKAKVSRNAYTGGTWRELRQLAKETNALLRDQRQAVEAIG